VNYFPLTKSQQDWKDRAAEVAQQELAPRAGQTDQNSQYPQESLDVLKKEGLFALQLTQNQMTTFGGTAFAGRLPFERYFRDARAWLVMGMANDAAYAGMIPIMFPPEN
jgi:alkylation response protein AidB-like acyl-CoA dehydrogenase